MGEKGGRNLYAFVSNNAINHYDVLGQYVGFDDAALFVGGALAGAAKWGVESWVTGEWNPHGLVANAVGGGLTAWTSEYVTPVGGALIGSAAESEISQYLDSGSIDPLKTVQQTVVGAATGSGLDAAIEKLGVKVLYKSTTKGLLTKGKRALLTRISAKSGAKITVSTAVGGAYGGTIEGAMTGFFSTPAESPDQGATTTVSTTGDLGTTWWGTDASGNTTRVTAGPMESSTDSAPAPGNAGNGDGGNAGSDGGNAGGDGGSAGGGGSGGSPEDPYKDPPKVQPE